MLRRVFVYGTLKRGQPNHYLISTSTNGNAKYLGEYRTVDKWPLVVFCPYNIPFVLDKPGTGQHIRGEIYEVDTPMLECLDKLEDHPTLYERKPIQVVSCGGNGIPTGGKDGSSASKETVANDSSVLDCEGYVLTNFVDEMLSSPTLENYDSKMTAGYVMPADRTDLPPSRVYVKKAPYNED